MPTNKPDTPPTQTHPGIPTTLQPHTHPIADLHPYPGNARRGNIDLIADSLATNGQYRPLVANRRTNQVLAGNHTLAAARHLGWTHVAVTWVDVDEEAAARIVLVDNRANDLAGYDDAELLRLLNTLPDLEGTGYDDDALDSLLSALGNPDGGTGHTDPDAAPVAPVSPLTRPGDVWDLGPHRLVCGDSTDPATWDALLGDELVHCIWSDPPYGVDYEGKTADALKIENDGKDLDQLEDLLRAAFTAALARCRPGAAWYIAAPAGPATLPFGVTLTELGIWRQTLVWVKNTFALGHSDYHYRHEVIYQGYGPKAPGKGRLGRGGKGWFGANNADTVLEVPKPARNADHPTMKPVELISIALQNSTAPGHLVADMFGGSGSTLIACHGTGRVARLIELDPRYADVICRRYQEHTGGVPVRNGEPVDFTAGDR